MDDEFELVPKDKIQSLLKENKELKNKILLLETSKSKETQNININSKLINEIKKELNLEQDNITTTINSIHEMSESTLNNVLERTEKLNTKTSEIGKSVGLLAQAISELVEVIPNNQNNINNKKEKTEENSKLTQEMSDTKSKVENIEKKLNKIEDFMSKLEKMLSQVKKIE